MKIYRGENVVNGNKERLRIIRECSLHTGFPSDMINGGNPYKIVKDGLTKSIVHHVAKDFVSDNESDSRKYWISFSSCKRQAEKYAKGYNGAGCDNDYDIIEDYYIENIGTDRERIWKYGQHFLVELNVNNKIAIPTFEGCYTLNYCDKSRNLLLVDVLTHLQSKPTDNPDVAAAIAYARTDKEWLVLPFDEIEGGTTLSAIIKDSPELSYSFYVNEDYYASLDCG